MFHIEGGDNADVLASTYFNFILLCVKKIHTLIQGGKCLSLEGNIQIQFYWSKSLIKFITLK